MYTGFFAKFGSTFVSEHTTTSDDSGMEEWLQPKVEQAVDEGVAAWICWPYSDTNQAGDIEQILNRFAEDLNAKRAVTRRSRYFGRKPIRCDHRRGERFAFLFVEAKEG